MDVVVVGGLTETKEFADEISFPFRTARWTVHLWLCTPGMIERGISLFLFVGANRDTADAAKGVAQAFDFAHIPCKPIAPFVDLTAPGTPIGNDDTAQRKSRKMWMPHGEKQHPNPGAPQ